MKIMFIINLFHIRWILVIFKREFSFNDVLILWELLWTKEYTLNFELFIALAILESHRDIILKYLLEVSDRLNK